MNMTMNEIAKVLKNKGYEVAKIAKKGNLTGTKTFQSPPASAIAEGEIVAYVVNTQADIKKYKLDTFGVRIESDRVYFPSVDDVKGITELNAPTGSVLKAEMKDSQINIWSPGKICNGTYEIDAAGQIVQYPITNLGILLSSDKNFDMSTIGIPNTPVEAISDGEKPHAWVNNDGVITVVQSWGVQSGKVEDVMFVIYGESNCAIITCGTPSGDENVVIDKENHIIETVNQAIMTKSVTA